jgi:hypothetical protein
MPASTFYDWWGVQGSRPRKQTVAWVANILGISVPRCQRAIDNEITSREKVQT